jgi:hypothetical protein
MKASDLHFTNLKKIISITSACKTGLEFVFFKN